MVGPGVSTILVARHGEAKYEVSEWDDEGGSLTRLGRRQAEALAESVRALGVAHVWTSTLARAVQTGEIVAARLGVGVTTRLGLCEIEAGDLDEARDTDRWLAIWNSWMDDDLEPRIPGGESGYDVAARVAAVLREVAATNAGQTALVVSHGAAIRVGVPALARVDVDRSPLGNGDSVEVRADADGWVCTRWGPEV